MNANKNDNAIPLGSYPRQANYDAFIEELTTLTRIYGVAIQSVGGIMVAENHGDFEEVTYRADITSGDLYPSFNVW